MCIKTAAFLDKYLQKPTARTFHLLLISSTQQHRQGQKLVNNFFSAKKYESSSLHSTALMFHTLFSSPDSSPDCSNRIQGGEFKSIVVENWQFFANGSRYC